MTWLSSMKAVEYVYFLVKRFVWGGGGSSIPFDLALIRQFRNTSV